MSTIGISTWRAKTSLIRAFVLAGVLNSGLVLAAGVPPSHEAFFLPHRKLRPATSRRDPAGEAGRPKRFRSASGCR